jgi:hypothetical protein
MIKIILLLLFIICYSDDKIIGGVNISYDMNSTNIKEVSLFISKSIKNNSLISNYKLRIKNVKDIFILDIANLSFKNSFGKIIIGKSKNRNSIIYESIQPFELIEKYDFFSIKDRINAISYIVPNMYDNVSEFDFNNKNKLRVFRSIWTKKKLRTSIFYLLKDENKILGIGLQKNTKIVNFGYSYENNIDIKTTHSISLIYKPSNYHYKSLYVFDSLDKEVFINGVDIFLLKNADNEAKIYLESSYGNVQEIFEIGAVFYF